MACNYRHLGSLHRARNLLVYVYKAFDELPKDLTKSIAVQHIKTAEIYMDKLEEEYKNE